MPAEEKKDVLLWTLRSNLPYKSAEALNVEGIRIILNSCLAQNHQGSPLALFSH